jgi:signal transduction histidine kinase
VVPVKDGRFQLAGLGLDVRLRQRAGVDFGRQLIVGMLAQVRFDQFARLARMVPACRRADCLKPPPRITGSGRAGEQSDVAGRAVVEDVAATREALGYVKSASRKALEELRDTISLLRQPGDPVAPTEIPAPGLDALAELLTELRGSGLAIDCQVTGIAVPLAPAADRTAYLVIRESLTNVYKHSARRRARLRLDYHRSELRVIVEDLGDGGSSERGGVKSRSVPYPDFLPTGRHGITGMRERVLALGGQFTAEPRPSDAFLVTAAVPYQPLALVAEPAP